MNEGRFIVREDKRSGEVHIVDVETKKHLDMSNKEDVKFLVELLNDYYRIVYDKWMI